MSEMFFEDLHSVYIEDDYGGREVLVFYYDEKRRIRYSQSEIQSLFDHLLALDWVKVGNPPRR